MKAAEFLSRLKSVRAAAPGRWVACCPAHQDHSPSLSVATGVDGRILVRCFAGCELQAIVDAVGLRVGDLFATDNQVQPRFQPALVPSRSRTPLPGDLRRGTCTELSTLAWSRGLDVFAGLEVVTRRGILWFTDGLRDGNESAGTSWVLTDSARRNAQARRLDGGLWKSIGDKKAKTFRGWEASWPIGLADVDDHNRPAVILVEGGPDLLAAATLAWKYASGALDDIGFACMTGAGSGLPSDALRLFAGRRVIIPLHVDAAGLNGGARWETQLRKAGADAMSFSLEGLIKPDGGLAKDLNDAVDAPELRELVEALFLLSA